MDFFNSVFSADPEPSISEFSSRGSPIPDDDRGQDGRGDESPRNSFPASADGGSGGIAGRWNFGGFVKTFATKSEFLIQTYHRDLADFGSVLKKETAAFREATARAVLNLPSSLDAGAAIAQESLESVGQVVDDLGASVWRGTAEIINHGKEAILSMEAGGDSSVEYPTEPGRPSSASSSRQYNRYQLLVLSIQSDISTFSEDPVNIEDFNKWRSEFDLCSKEEEIKNLCSENVALDGFLNKLVPDVLDYTTFWCRYYYRVHKLKQAEDARAELVKRVISREEEDLSWEIDDHDQCDGEKIKKEEKTEGDIDKNRDIDYVEGEDKNDRNTHSVVVDSAMQNSSEVSQVERSKFLDEKIAGEGSFPGNSENTKSKVEYLISKLDEAVMLDEIAEAGESCKDSDFSIISSHNSSPEEDDIGWDEIEDLAEHDEKKSGGSNEIFPKVDLGKRLSAAEEDEVLSWEIEDHDYPSKP